MISAPDPRNMTRLKQERAGCISIARRQIASASEHSYTSLGRMAGRGGRHERGEPDTEGFFAAEDATAHEHAAKPNGVDNARGDRKHLVSINPTTLAEVPVPPRQWLVRDWIPMERVTANYANGGEGKTIIAQMLATSCALGKPWLGLPVRQCNSLLFFCEDDLDEMHRRQQDINGYFGRTFADLGAIRWLPRLGDDNAFMTFDSGPQHTPLFYQLLGAAKEHRAKLIVTDTLADIFTGNENDRGQARAFAQSALGFLARETGGAVLALAHPSRAGLNSGSGESGSTAWIGTFRSQLYLSTPKREDGEPPDPNLRVLTRKKSNAARRDETIELRWSDGVFVPVHEPTGIIASIERRTCERVFLDLLDKTIAEGQPLSSNPKAGNYAPRLFATRPDRERFGRADFQRAMQALFATHAIINEGYGRKSDMRTRMVRKPS
jgi:RecA-family ATPase